ncbi:MAG: hypothetical protein SCH98_09250 [Deferrisomatales bacterium]|nr:hypothetical protein [Deferrisomatales bacterium]
MPEVPTSGERAQGFATLSEGLEEILDASRRYPEPEPVSRVLEALAGVVPAPGAVAEVYAMVMGIRAGGPGLAAPTGCP